MYRRRSFGMGKPICDLAFLAYKNSLPVRLFLSRMSAGTIQNELSDESKVLWGYRKVKEQIILMDWDSDNGNVNAPIATLKNILLQWDPDVKYNNPILMLAGGYGGFMDFYPTLTTNSSIRRPRKVASIEMVNLEDIEYSNIHEVPMRDDRIFQQMNNVPMIDRSSKAAAERLYNTEELQYEREKLVDQSLLNEQNILDKITELKDENLHKYDGDVAKLEEARLNINNERMELEDKQEELQQMKLQIHQLQEQVLAEKAKNEEKMNVDINAEVEKRIAEKERIAEVLRLKRKMEAEAMEKRQRELEVRLARWAWIQCIGLNV